MTKRIRRRQPDFPAFSREWPRVSVVVLLYKSPQFIANCLLALRAQDYPDFEVVVVDNASSDETRQAIEKGAENETLVFNEKNRGFAGGCNDGIDRASGEVVVLLNDDTVVRPDWLTELVRPMTRDPRVAVAGCKMLFPGSNVIQHAGGILHPNGMTQHVGYEEEDRGQYDEERDVPFVTGAGIALRRAFLDLCGGGLDEDYYPAYCEELDLCYRAGLMEYRVVYAPRSVMEHFESPSLDNQSPIFQRLVNRGRILFCVKNFTLRQWVFGFVPFEFHWMRMPWSKGKRKKQFRAYLDGLKFLLGFRHSPDKPFPGI